jgi:hypothetical protein
LKSHLDDRRPDKKANAKNMQIQYNVKERDGIFSAHPSHSITKLINGVGQEAKNIQKHIHVVIVSRTTRLKHTAMLQL